MKGLYKLYNSLQIYVDSSFQIEHSITLSTSSGKYSFIKFGLHRTFSNPSQFGFPWELDRAPSLQQIRVLLLHQSIKMLVPQALGHMAPPSREAQQERGLASAEPPGGCSGSVCSCSCSVCMLFRLLTTLL